MKTFNHHKHSPGFTLVEALVAITVLIIGVLGPLTVASRGISDGIFAQNQLIANYLAQEGLELVINRIDSNKKRSSEGRSWLDGFSNCINGNSCYTDVTMTDTEGLPDFSGTCPVSAPDQCWLAYTNGLYQALDPNSSTGTQFRRTIALETGATDNEVKVSVKLEWFNKATPKELTLVEYLYQCPASPPPPPFPPPGSSGPWPCKS